MSNAHNLFCCFVLCIRHFSFSWLQIEERKKKTLRGCGSWFLRAIFVIVNMFMALTQKLWCYEFKHKHNGREMKWIFAHHFFLFLFSLFPCRVLKWIERNGTHTHTHTPPDQYLKNLFWRCWAIVVVGLQQLNEMCSSSLSRHKHRLFLVLCCFFLFGSRVCLFISWYIMSAIK